MVIKLCVLGNTQVKTKEEIMKAKGVLNMITCMGVRRDWIDMLTANLI